MKEAKPESHDEYEERMQQYVGLFHFMRIVGLISIVLFLLLTLPVRTWNGIRKLSGLPGYETYPGGGFMVLIGSAIGWMMLIGIAVKLWQNSF